MDSLKRATDCDQDRRLREDERFQEAQRALDAQAPDRVQSFNESIELKLHLENTEQLAKFADFMKEIKVATGSEQLRKAITDSGFTYYHIMQETGISDGAISRFMSGERSITMETADALIHFLGLELTHKKKRRKSLVLSDFELPYKSKEFAQAWSDWLKHKRSFRKPWSKKAGEKCLEMLGEWGEEIAIKSINMAIAGGWQLPRNVAEMQGSGEYGLRKQKQDDGGFFEDEDVEPLSAKKILEEANRKGKRYGNGIVIKGGSIF